MLKAFSDSYKELKKLKTIVITALLMAIGIILGQFSIQISQSVKIGISFIATQMTANLFGPVVGGIMGGAADILKFIIRPTGPFLIGYTISAMLGPMIYGVMLYKKPISFWRIFLSKAVVAILINLLLGTFWSYHYFGAAFWAGIPAKLVQQVIQVPVQSVIYYFVMMALKKAKVFQLIA
jgi:ECF transporter S component (folate family)